MSNYYPSSDDEEKKSADDISSSDEEKEEHIEVQETENICRSSAVYNEQREQRSLFSSWLCSMYKFFSLLPSRLRCTGFMTVFCYLVCGFSLPFGLWHRNIILASENSVIDVVIISVQCLMVSSIQWLTKACSRFLRLCCNDES